MSGIHGFDSNKIAKYKLALMKLNGVEAVGEAEVNGVPCLKVYFIDQPSLEAAKVPSSVQIPVYKVVSGSIHSQ